MNGIIHEVGGVRVFENKYMPKDRALAVGNCKICGAPYPTLRACVYGYFHHYQYAIIELVTTDSTNAAEAD